MKNKQKSIEEIYCPECAHKNSLKWNTFIRYAGMPYKYKCVCCGKYYFENEDE